ncbi:MAG: amino acid--tRNA ligase-related protein [Nitrospiraceae bacterium]
MFQTQYFDETAYLTQSGQLYSEATAARRCVSLRSDLSKGEKSKTRRHLMEFWMVEPEVAFAELSDMMELAEQFLSHIVAAGAVLRHRRGELQILERDIAKLERVVAPFPRITYEDAIALLQRRGNPAEVG